MLGAEVSGLSLIEDIGLGLKVEDLGLYFKARASGFRIPSLACITGSHEV